MESIREWYMSEFSSDVLGGEISHDATFNGLWKDVGNKIKKFVDT